MGRARHIIRRSAACLSPQPIGVRRPLFRGGWFVAAGILAVLLVESATPSLGFEPPVCVTAVGGDAVGRARGAHDSTSTGHLLLWGADGLFAYEPDRLIRRVSGHEIGTVRGARSNARQTLIWTESGLFLYGASGLSPLVPDTGPVYAVHDLIDGSLLIWAQKGFFHYVVAGELTFVEGSSGRSIHAMHGDGGSGVIIWTDIGPYHYDVAKGLSRIRDDQFGRVETAEDDGVGGVLVSATRGLFRWSPAGTLVRLEGILPGEHWQLARTPRGSLLFFVNNRMLVYRPGESRLTTEDLDVGRIYGWDEHLLDDGVMLATERGIFRYSEGEPLKKLSDFDIGFGYDRHRDRAAGLLVRGRNALFRYSAKDGVVRIQGPNPDRIFDSLQLTSSELLLRADNGLFRLALESRAIERVSRDQKGEFFADGDGSALVSNHRRISRYAPDGTIERIPGPDTGALFGWHRDSHGHVVARSERGLFRVVNQPLAAAEVTLENERDLAGTRSDNRAIAFQVRLAHECAAIAGDLNLQLVAVDPNGSTTRREATIIASSKDGAATLTAAFAVPHPGRWSFHVVSIQRGQDVAVGKPLNVVFASSGSHLVGWGVLGVVMVGLTNIMVLVAARWYPAAWRLATDDSWGSLTLRLLTMLLSHWRPSQLWVLEPYVRRQRDKRARTGPPRYLPVPLRNTSAVIESGSLLERIRVARHVWVQGPSGMGKTALMRQIAWRHFMSPDDTTAAAIFRRDGFVLVPIEGRRYFEPGNEESRDPAWLVGCVHSVLASHGLPFQNDRMLRAMLRTGTLCVALDGVDEAGRATAVASFVDEFPDAPLVAASQDDGESLLERWHLPADVVDYVELLLKLYLGAEKGAELSGELVKHGLSAMLQSGYDVRLLADLAASKSGYDWIPRGRIELYAAFVESAWPSATQTRLIEDRQVLEAAAWNLIARRGPAEDKRRIRPDVDAPLDLLRRLAAVDRGPGQIRLLRRIGGAFEFVHDQMNAFLAARWLAGRPTVEEIAAMLTESQIWSASDSSQRTLWGFFVTMLPSALQEELWGHAWRNKRWAALREALEEAQVRAGREIRWS